MTERAIGIAPWVGTRRSKALARVRHNGRRRGTPCIICELPIDYSLAYPHPMSCSVQHIKPRSTFPELTWEPSNWAPAHLSCNQSDNQQSNRSRSTATPTQAPVSTAW